MRLSKELNPETKVVKMKGTKGENNKKTNRGHDSPAMSRDPGRCQTRHIGNQCVLSRSALRGGHR
jgi:hypothetical protein